MRADDDRPERILEILPLAPFPTGLAQEVAIETSRRLSAPCRLLTPAAVLLPTVPGRSQADADRVLASLEARAAAGTARIVGLTTSDIGSPLFTHFFGRARLGGSAALVSVARLTPTYYGLPEDAALTTHRTILEVLHEVGHLAGLEHCRDRDCVMFVTRTVEDLDQRGTAYCEPCAARLPPDLQPRLAP